MKKSTKIPEIKISTEVVVKVVQMRIEDLKDDMKNIMEKEYFGKSDFYHLADIGSRIEELTELKDAFESAVNDIRVQRKEEKLN